jgi:glycine dehydrogenase
MSIGKSFLKAVFQTFSFYTFDICWTPPYSRKRAGNPDGNHQENKYWPPVNRVNNALGDRALICACPPMEFWEQQAAE